MSIFDSSFWTDPLFPTLHEYITFGSTEGFWERPLFPQNPDELRRHRSGDRSTTWHPSLEALDKRELMAADLTPVDGTLFVHGTDDADEISFVAGTEFHQVGINGQVTQVAVDDVQNVRIYGSQDDTVSIEGSPDKVDRFLTSNTKAELRTEGLNVKAYGFGDVQSQSTGDAEDRAYMVGTTQNDELEGGPDQLTLKRPQSEGTVTGYSRVYIYGGRGTDSASLQDSAGDDKFWSQDGTDVLSTTDAYVRMKNFEDLEIEATQGGNDRAYQRGTDGDDLLILTEDVMKLSSTFKTVTVDGFERTYAYAGEGEDTVRVYDSVFSDSFEFESEFESTGERNSIDGKRETVRFYSTEFYRRAEGFFLTEAVRVSPDRMAGSFAESGAVSINIDYEAGLREDYYIEQQRRGAELIEAGLATGHTELTEIGIQMIQWGLDQQAADGGFPNCDDAVHSTTLFMRAVGHAILKFDENPFEGFTPAMRVSWIDGLTRMSDWVIANQDLQPELNLEPFSHRYFLRALGFRQVHLLTGLDRFDDQATSYFDEAITRLNRHALLIEDGGFDLNYQSFGLRLAADYYDITSDETELGRTQRMRMSQLFRNSYFAINARIDSEGIADMSDSSRANEVGREGNLKTYDYRNAIHAFLASYRITKRQEFFELAARTFNGSRS